MRDEEAYKAYQAQMRRFDAEQEENRVKYQRLNAREEDVYGLTRDLDAVIGDLAWLEEKAAWEISRLKEELDARLRKEKWDIKEERERILREGRRIDIKREEYMTECRRETQRRTDKK